MIESGVVLSSAKYYEEAKKMLEVRDLIGFVSNVTSAILLANSSNDQEMLAQATYLQAIGLVKFRQFSKVSESVDQAMKYNLGDEALDLKKRKGLAKGYLGELDEALAIFKELLTESDDCELIAGACVNIAWVHLTLNKNVGEKDLIESKRYLDLAEEKFDLLSNDRKWKVRNAYSVYYFYAKDYEKAIDVLENSIEFCNEEYLSDAYNNLAELYIKIAKSDNSVVPENVKDYLKKAELFGLKFKNNISLGYTFYFMSEIELLEEQLFRALDTLNLAFDLFKEAEATVMACDCLIKINELMDRYKHENLESIRLHLKEKVKNTLYSKQIS